MNQLPHSITYPWLHRFAVFTALATLALLGVGGLVTSHGVGMAVPDWPNTYGYNMFLFPVSKWVGGIFYEHSHRLVASFIGLLTAILAAWLWARETRGGVKWLGLGAILLVLVLMGIRKLPMYIALAALAPVVIGIGLYQFKCDPRRLRWLGIVALAAVILQGVLGGLRVVLYRDELGIFHATLAQLFFVLVCAIALLTSHWWAERRPPARREASNDSKCAGPKAGAPVLHWIALVVTLLILCQLILGATMRHQHAGLAVPDFPLAYGKLWPAMDADSVAHYNQQRLEITAANPITAVQIGLQVAHRLMALVIVIAVGIVAWLATRPLTPSLSPDRERGKHPRSLSDAAAFTDSLALRRLALVWFGLILVQAALGAATIWTNKAADVATAHVLVGALSLVTGAIWCIIGFRSFAPVAKTRPVTMPVDAVSDDSFDAPAAVTMNK